MPLKGFDAVSNICPIVAKELTVTRNGFSPNWTWCTPTLWCNSQWLQVTILGNESSFAKLGLNRYGTSFSPCEGVPIWGSKDITHIMQWGCTCCRRACSALLVSIPVSIDTHNTTHTCPTLTRISMSILQSRRQHKHKPWTRGYNKNQRTTHSGPTLVDWLILLVK